jgi:hypothetical protein
MITKLMNKWMFTVCKDNCHFYTLCLPYASLHHNLLDICKYLMMQSSLWQMVRNMTSEGPIFNILEGFAGRGQ